MARKRPVEVLILSDSDDEAPPVASTSGSGASSRTSQRSSPVPENQTFEADLAKAMALSLAGTGQRAGSQENLKAVGGANVSRAELERERLARQKAREASGAASPAAGIATARPASTSSPWGNKRAKVATLSDLTQDEGAASTKSSSSAPSSSRISTSSLLTGSAPSFSSSSSSSHGNKVSQRFWQGAVKRVPNAWHPDPDSWSFDDLIGDKSTLDAAVVSAYCLEPEWVVSHFPDETPLLLVMQGPDNGRGELGLCKLKPNSYIQLVADKKPFAYRGCMHTKLNIYYHATFVRIIIPTANAMSYDYETMDNAVFVQDFPVRQPLPANFVEDDDSGPFTNPTHTDYSKRFFQVCYLLGVPKKFVKISQLYDYSASADVRLVQSMQGKFSLNEPAEANKGGGLCALAKAVASHQFAPGGRWEIEVTGSSLGQLSPSWLAQFYAACQGVSPLSYFPGRNGRKGSTNPPEDVVSAGSLKHPVRLPIKLMFATEKEILGSWQGAEHGGTTFCRPTQWNGKSYPRHLFHRQESKRDRVPAHTKIILALKKYKDPTAQTAVHEGWMYLGSHNFTPSAWGALQNGVGGPQIANNNYELGVVIPIRANSAEELEKKASEMVTYKRPLVPYSRDDVAWQQDLFK
ncbi:hypothetical protein JCM11251_007186 [Rhodosporidiobolus azoricus]